MSPSASRASIAALVPDADGVADTVAGTGAALTRDAAPVEQAVTRISTKQIVRVIEILPDLDSNFYGMVRPPARPSNGQGHADEGRRRRNRLQDRKSTRLNSSHQIISYAVFCLKKKKKIISNVAMYKYLMTMI